MTFSTPRLLARLRRHRGAWVLAMAVLLFKVVVSTSCLLDGPRPVSAFPGSGAVATLVDAATVDDGGCLLDEGEGCHCSCAHAVALPAMTTPRLVALPLFHAHARLTAASPPDASRSLLRPPIA